MDFDDIIVIATEVFALLVVVVVENWFCPFGAKTTTVLKTLLEAAEAVFFIVVFALKEEEEEEETDEIAWFIVTDVSSKLWRETCVFRRTFLCGGRNFKKKKRKKKAHMNFHMLILISPVSIVFV